MSSAFRSGLFAAAILTGGQARRLRGQDKSRLVMRDDGRTILERQLDMLAPIASEILIVTSAERLPDFAALASTEGEPPIRVITDHYPLAGPLGAIVTALETAHAGEVLVLGGDMPNITATFVRALAAAHERDGHQITAPESSRGVEPLAAIYARSARGALLEALSAGELSLQQAIRAATLGVVPAHTLVEDEMSDALFRNINTPDDF